MNGFNGVNFDTIGSAQLKNSIIIDLEHETIYFYKEMMSSSYDWNEMAGGGAGRFEW